METALITGASEGIGYEFSKLFANKGVNLILVARNESRLQAISKELASDKDKVAELLDLLTSYLRDMLILKGGGDGIANIDLLPMLERESARITQERIMERIGHVAAARQALVRNVNSRLTLEVLFMRLAEQQ